MSYEAPIRNEHIIVYYVILVVLYCFLMIGRKFYFKYRRGISFAILPNLGIRNISSISMMTAMNIALIISISLLSNQIMGIFFKVYPGARFLIENILIKLGGILFGPWVGIFIGFSTDLLTVIFTSSVLNYGYFFAAMMNGFLGGLIHQIIYMKGKNQESLNIKKTICSIAFATVALFFVGIVLSANSLGRPYNARILSLNVSMHWYTLFLLITVMVMVAMFCLVMSTFATLHVNDPKYNYKRWIRIMSEKYTFFLITMCNVVIYLLVDMIALPMFDVSLSSLPYEQFLVCRIIVSIPSVILFSYLIHYIYKLYINIKPASAMEITPPQKENAKRRKELLPRLMF